MKNSLLLYSLFVLAIWFPSTSSAVTNLWPNFRGNNLNNGNSSLNAEEDEPSDASSLKISEFQTKGIIWGTPIVDGEGGIYVGTSQKLFHKFDSSGKLEWTYKIKDLADSLIDSAGALTETGKVIVPGGDGFLHALDTKTGKPLWTFAANDADPEQAKTGVTVNSFEGNVTVHNGIIYAGCDNGYLYAVDDSGKKIWSFRTNMMIWSSPAFSPKGDWMAFGSLDRNLYLLEPKTGKLLAKIATDGDVKSSPATDGKNIYFGTSSEKVMAVSVDKNSGGYSLKNKWEFITEGEVYSSPAHKDGSIFIGTLRGMFYRLSASNGTLEWTYKTHSPIASSPIVSSDGIVFFGAKNSKLYALKAKSGVRVWSYKTSDSLYKTNLDSSPTLFHNSKETPTIVVGSYDGKVFFIPTLFCKLNPTNKNCATGGTQDDLDFEGKIEANSSGLRFVDRQGRLLSQAREPVALFEPIQLRLIAFENGLLIDNAAVSSFPLVVEISPKIELRQVVSSDGSILNLIPVNGYAPDTKYKLQISGRYYRNTHWVWNRLNWLGLTLFSDTIEFTTGKDAAEPKKKGIIPSHKLWGIHSMYLTQPQALDTYIPAALDGQAFLVSGFGFHKNNGKFLMLAQPALPSVPSPILLVEPSKSFVLEATQNGSFFQATGKMAIAAMGAAFKFEETVLSGLFSPSGEIKKGEFFVDTSCLGIKGNGGDYQFPMSLVSWICDHRLHVIGLGSLEGMELKVPTLYKKLDIVKFQIHDQQLKVQIDNSRANIDMGRPHLFNYIEYDPKEVKVLRTSAARIEPSCWNRKRKCDITLKLEGTNVNTKAGAIQIYLDQTPIHSK